MLVDGSGVESSHRGDERRVPRKRMHGVRVKVIGNWLKVHGSKLDFY